MLSTSWFHFFFATFHGILLSGALFLPCFPNPQVTVPGSVGYLIMANTAKGPVSSKKCDWMSRVLEVNGSMVIGSMGFNLLINGVYFECGPLTVRVTTKIITFLGSGIPT